MTVSYLYEKNLKYVLRKNILFFLVTASKNGLLIPSRSIYQNFYRLGLFAKQILSSMVP